MPDYWESAGEQTLDTREKEDRSTNELCASSEGRVGALVVVCVSSDESF